MDYLLVLPVNILILAVKQFLVGGSRGKIVYLRSYSPDLNKIEQCWSWLKSRIRSEMSSNYWFEQALDLYKLGKYSEAIASFDKALEFKPDFHEALEAREILRKLGR